MTSRLLRLTSLTIAMVATCPPFGSSQARIASWLDDPKPASWSTPGAPIPAAPKTQGAADPRCRETARPPQLAEDKRVRDRGWDLVGAYHGGWQVLVIRGTAGYDGMCRPWQYQDFVFVRGVFAGTLSPRAMDSRTDGALTGVFLRSGGQLAAEYVRYSGTDPLCCPSRTTSVAFELGGEPPVLRPLSASTSEPGRVQAGTGSPAPAGLAGTSWRLVKFEGSDDTTLTPVDRATYTLEFAAGGQLSARIDCNRGRGTWKSSGPSQIELGPLALTRAACPPGSLHDQIVKQWGNIRSYVIRDGHLFLALMADGGIYEFEPATAK
jgi:heat shock protein HslJ